MKTVISFVIVVLAGFVMTGCVSSWQYVRVVSTINENTFEVKEDPEVTVTPEYQETINSIKSVALRAPDICSDSSVSGVTGDAEEHGSEIKSLCGVQMADIEKELIRNGYIVYSWKAVNGSSKMGKTYIDAAKELGADVLLEINSLEKVLFKPGKSSVITREFVETDRNLQPVGAPQLTSHDKNALIKLAKYREWQLFEEAISVGSILDVAAVSVDTGRSIWFYRWSKQEFTGLSLSRQILTHTAGKRGSWKIYGAYRVDALSLSSQMSQSEESSEEAQPASAFDNIAYKLVGDLIKDFVVKFKSGKP